MATQWYVEVLDHFTLEWARLRPTRDGAPVVFTRRIDALEWSYDAGWAGKRNQHVRYVKSER